MIIEYDTNGTARHVMMSLNFTLLRTVELHVTLLGCDHGYYADAEEKKRTALLVCRECLCDNNNNNDDDAIFFGREKRGICGRRSVTV